MKVRSSNNWEQTLLDDVRAAVRNDPYWGSRLADFSTSIHLAIFVEPFLQYILEGKKTVESRFSKHLCPPHKKVSKGDSILLKKSSGAVMGVCQVVSVWFYTLDPESVEQIREEYAAALCASTGSFWKARQNMAYATLMQVSHVLRIEPVSCAKQDRRGWVVVKERNGQGQLLRSE